MNIIKGNFNQPFVIVYNEAIQDVNLSMQAKGLLSYLLSLPEDWIIHARELHNNFTNGRDACIAALNELIEAEFVIKTENRDGGQFDGIKYKVYPLPYKRAVEMGLITQEGNVQEPKQTKDPVVPSDKKTDKPPYKEIIDRLNEKAGKNYKHTSKATQKHINGRWGEGFRLDDFYRVIDYKAKEWKNDQRMAGYLRPETLFGTKFESYLNSIPKKFEFSHKQQQQREDNEDWAIKNLNGVTYNLLIPDQSNAYYEALKGAPQNENRE